MAVVNDDDVRLVLVIKRDEEDPENKKVKRGKEKVLNGNEEVKEEAVHEELPEPDKLNMVDATTTRPTKKRSKGEAVNELHQQLEKLNMAEATTTMPTKEWSVDILEIIRGQANDLGKRVEILTFNNVVDAVENQIEYPRELSFMVVEQIFETEIRPALKLPGLRFIPCVIFSRSPPATIRKYLWNNGSGTPKTTLCTIGIIRQFIQGIWSGYFATMRMNGTKVDDALSTTEKTSSEEEEEDEPGDGEFEDGEGQRGTRRRIF